MSETNSEKLTRLRKGKAEAEQAQAETREAAEIACLEVEEKLRASGAKLNVDFSVVFDPDLGPDGVIAVQLGSDLAFRKFLDVAVSADGLAPAADMYDFVAPALVHPTAEKYAEIVRTRGGLANRACDALTSLHRVRGKKIEGKF
jgi:hypothetical protein